MRCKKAHATLFIDLFVTAISLMITTYIVPGFIVIVVALIAAVVLGLVTIRQFWCFDTATTIVTLGLFLYCQCNHDLVYTIRVLHRIRKVWG